MAKGWHNTHIPTRFGVGILVILLIGLVFVVLQVGQTQNLSSNAMTSKDKGGGYAAPTSGVPTSRPQPKSAPKAPTVSKCYPTVNRKTIQGSCQSSCSGNYKAYGYCSNGKRCCVSR